MSFSDLTADRAIAEQLHRSLQRGRLAHAYLFSGPRDSGTETMATALAQALNCLQEKYDTCGACDSCRRIADGTHPDVYWMRPESKSRRIRVEQIREFQNVVALKPAVGRMKVGIVVDADCMTEEAGNAFLKTLEEPPSRTIIVLLTTEPQRLLPTILSRCLRISFGRTVAKRSPEQEKTLALLAEFSRVRPRGIVNVYCLHAALTALLGQMRTEIQNRIEAELDARGYDTLEADAREKLEEQQAAQIEGEYRGVREQLLEEMYAWFGDVLLCVAGAGPDLLAHPDRLTELQQAAAGLAYDRAATHLDAIERIRDALARNISEPFALEVGLLKLV